MTFTSYAQNFEDVLLSRALRDVEQGHYLDIGAQDPVLDSVSLAFYERGWRGVHVEPTPAYAAKLRQHRPDETVVEAVVTDAPGLTTFFEIPETGISTGKKTIAAHHAKKGYAANSITVPTVRLDHLLDLFDGDVHWVKIDVEGMEREVLRSWGESSKRPWILVIEATFPTKQDPTEKAWLPEVLKRDYSLAFFDGLSRYFVHRSHADLIARFEASVNIFDDFVVSPQHFVASRLREQLAETQATIQAERDRARDLEATVASLRQLEALSESQAERLRELDRARGDAEQARAEAEQARGDADQALAQAEQARANAEQALAQAEQARASADQALAQAERRHSELADQLATALRDHANAIERMARERVEAEAHLHWLAGEVQNKLHDEVRAAEARANAKDVEIARYSERQKALEADIAGREQAIQKLESDLQAVRSALANEAGARSDAEQQVRDAKARLAKAEEVHADLSGQLQQQAAQLAHLSNLVQTAVAERPDFWQRMGRRLGFTAVGPGWRALANWPGSSETLPSPVPRSGITTEQDELSMRTPQSPAEQMPASRAASLRELLSLHDEDFVRSVYVTLLGREPDDEGLAYYLDRLRSGRSQLHIMAQFRSSREARDHDPGIAGLDRAIRRARWERAPIIGGLVRLLTGNQWESPANQVARALVEANGRSNRRFAQLEDQLYSLASTVRSLSSAPPVAAAVSVGVEQPVRASHRPVRLAPVVALAQQLRTQWLAA